MGTPTRVVVGVDDLGTDEIAYVLKRASDLRAGAETRLLRPPLVEIGRAHV